MGLKLMLVVAHPDDECFAFGGALALAAERGIETYVICLTDGQAATYRGEAASGEELGRRSSSPRAGFLVSRTTNFSTTRMRSWSSSISRRQLVSLWSACGASSRMSC